MCIRDSVSYGFRPSLATLRLHLQSWMPLATRLNRSSTIPSRVIHMPIGCGNNRRNRHAMPQYVTSTSGGRRPCRSTFCRATPRTSVPPSRTSENWPVKVGCKRPTTISSFSFVTQPRRCRIPLSLARWDVLLVCCTTSPFASTFPFSCALGSCKLVIRRFLATLVPTRTLPMLERFY